MTLTYEIITDAKPDLNIFEIEWSLTARASAIMKAMKEGMETGYLTVKENKKVCDYLKNIFRMTK